ncbi:O-acyltransferase like protein-like [Ptychodera flava]|uniref:O-acyltransferase like protein-like n=1 Tax=Ptychodera flava TaxID=63121 RepID=UPI00396A01D0
MTIKNIKAALTTVAVIVLLGRFVEAQNVMDATFAVLSRTLQNNTNTTNPLQAVTMPCYWDTVKYMRDLNTSKTYARSMYYSTGRFQEDYDLTWNVKDVGDFTMCQRSVGSEEHEISFVAKYCLTHTNIDPTYEITMAVCLPNSCSDEDVKTLVRAGYLERNHELPWWTYTKTLCSPVYYLWRWSDFLAIFICTVLSIFIVCCTIYDIMRRRKMKKKKKEASKISPEYHGLENLQDNGEVQETVEEQTPVQSHTSLTAEVTIEETSQPPASAKDNKKKGKLTDVAIAFSVLDTSNKIFNMNPSKGSIGCLNGIRVISMFWIIVFHTWLLLASPTYIRNVRYLEETVKARHAVQVLLNGELGVEAFFVLGGLLVSYLTLKKIDKSGGHEKVSWLRFFAHRYLRLTPAYAFILLLYSTITIHMGEGIWWPYWYGAQLTCHHSWWSNLLYIHHLYPFPGSTSECMGWSWYLSVDMQLYFISPLFIVLLYNRLVIGIVVSVITTLCSFAISAYLNYALARSIGRSPSYGEPALPEGAWLYTKPYYRITQYLIGIILGYVLFRLKGRKVKIHKVLNVFLWCCSTIVAYLVIYGPSFTSDDRPAPRGPTIFYLSTHRFLLSVCIGWVIFACATGNGGPVDQFLSWRGWLPLARVNYCAYLLHLTVILMYTWGLKYLWFYSDFNMAVVSIAMVAITYALAVVFTMVIEIPIIGLEKIFFPDKNKKNK